MTRVMSYNILSGGVDRVEPLAAIIGSKKPELVGLIEATNDGVVERLAEQLGMEYRLSGRTKAKEAQQGALLTRLPIRSTTTHINGILTKQPLLEVCVELPDGQELTVFVTHLTASFSQGWRANLQRRREIKAILSKLALRRGTPHVLMGDFNSIAPGERVKGSLFLRFVLNLHHYSHLHSGNPQGLPDLDYVLPRPLRFLKPAFYLVANSRLLGAVLDHLDWFYAPRSGIDLLLKAGYVDCFRSLHPKERGYSWPAPMPAGRIDFIFASPECADTLSSCEIVNGAGDVPGSAASDHLPVFAVFDTPASIRRSEKAV